LKILTIFEQIILASIITLKNNAYGVTIREKARGLSGKSIMYGSLYNILDQLCRKGYVTRTKKSPDSGEGGHERIYYTLTSAGIEALRKAQSIQKAIQESLPAFAEEE
jgi:PadR family transcriptional regulator PadR